MSQSFPPSPDKARNARMMALRRHGGFALHLAIGLPLVGGILLVAQALLLANILGRVIQEGAAVATVTPFVLAVAAILLVRIAIGVTGEQAGQIAAEKIKLALRRALFAHEIEKRNGLGLAPASGAIATAIVDQTEAIEAFFARYLPAMIGAVFLPITFAVVLFPVDWIIALLFLFTAPAIPLFMALAGMGAQAATDRQANALSRLSAYFADRLRGIVTLKLFGREQDAIADVHKASEDLRRRTNRVLVIAFLSSAILEFFAALGVAGVALYVGLTYLGFLPFHPELTLTMGFFALLMAPEVYQPLRQLAAHYHDRAAARSAIEQIENQIGKLDALTILQPAKSPLIRINAAALAIEDLTVKTSSGRAILDDLNLSLSASQSLAIMGESGIGKTTLMRAIARLIPYEGQILIDGTETCELPEAQLRQRLAVITQKPRIFHGTLSDNIRFAAPQASDEAVQTAARRARVMDFVSDMPEGLDTLVGEGGEGLSGGQAQRIALARLFLIGPGLIILDEPTAHLDPETEAAVLDEIFAFAAGRTLIVLTHSRSVAARADKAMRLAGGKLHTMPHMRSAAANKEEHRA